MQIGHRNFDTANQTYIMGILNVTPDSFSDGGNYTTLDLALCHGEKMITEGADIIDIGGESTRPSYTMISDEEEIERIVPVIEAFKKRFDIPLSVDTYKSKVAAAALSAGADLINDIWGLKYDADMAKTVAQYKAACCLMHNRTDTNYYTFIEDVKADLAESVGLAMKAGIAKEKIILDPGVGFAKSYTQNQKIIQCLEAFSDLNFPVLLGTSRKSVIGLALDLPTGERLEGTLVTTVFAVLKGCSFVRVHDVKENQRAIAMTRAIVTAGLEGI